MSRRFQIRAAFFRRLPLCLCFAVLLLIVPITAAQVSTSLTYTDLLSQSAIRLHQSKQLDEADEVVRVLAAGGTIMYPSEIAARLRQEFPRAARDAPILLLPSMRQALVPKGPEYERLVRALDPILRVCWLENSIVPILYRSEYPAVTFIWPNVVAVSTRTMDTLTDGELQGLAAHEVCHLIARKVFTSAVDNHDYRILRMLELFYDAGSVAILVAKNKDPSLLITGLEKLQAIQQVDYGEDDRKGDHPTLRARKRLNTTLSHQFYTAAAR